MMKVTVDVDGLTKTRLNVHAYTAGFVTEVQAQRLVFMTQLGEFLAELLGHYIDAQAKMAPERLHHVYEWGRAGDQSARLFDFDMVASIDTIKIKGKFYRSQSTPPGGGEPFRDKAEIMEAGTTVTIAPKDSDVLAFEVDGGTVFTSKEVTVEHPGGPEVEGAFGDTVYDFFDIYVNKEVIEPILKRFRTLTPYSKRFASGARGGGASAGKAAARELMFLPEVMDEV